MKLIRFLQARNTSTPFRLINLCALSGEKDHKATPLPYNDKLSDDVKSSGFSLIPIPCVVGPMTLDLESSRSPTSDGTLPHPVW